ESLAEIEVSATGGTAPYEFATDLSGPWVAGTPTLVLPVDAGVYQYYARDINGCLSFVSNGVPITPVTPLQAGLGNSILYVTCNGFDNAIIRATATGGLGEYEFELYNGDPEANASLIPIRSAQQSNQFENIEAGTYFIKVLSIDCEDVYGPIDVTEPTPLVEDIFEFTNPTCTGEG